MSKKFKLGVIGCGFMASSIINGVCKSNFINPEEIIVSEKRAVFDNIENKNVTTITDNLFLANNSEYVLFAVKPQSIDEVFDEIKSCNADKFISILAGVKICKYKDSFKNVKVARCMPNTPCSIGKGVVAIDTTDFSLEETDFIVNLFKSLGEVLLTEESKMNAVTGISGSGPAYVYLFIKGLIEAGVNQGLSYDEAKILATNTVIGSGEMVKRNPERAIDELINAVCSKGGTTIEAVNSFNDNKFLNIIDQAVMACVERAKELGGEKITPKEVMIYTDGACSGNPGVGGWSAILISGDKKKEISGGESLTTNNRMELIGVISGLKALKKPCEVKLYTDSQYVCDAINKDWISSWKNTGWINASKNEVKNVDLWKELLALLSVHKVEFIKVKGHADNEYNNRCDFLAREECKKRQN